MNSDKAEKKAKVILRSIAIAAGLENAKNQHAEMVQSTQKLIVRAISNHSKTDTYLALSHSYALIENLFQTCEEQFDLLQDLTSCMSAVLNDVIDVEEQKENMEE